MERPRRQASFQLLPPSSPRPLRWPRQPEHHASSVPQLQLSFSKRLSCGHVKIDPKLDIFNALNSDDYFTVRSATFSPVSNPALATGLAGTGSGGTYLQPGSILQGRLLRIGAVINW